MRLFAKTRARKAARQSAQQSACAKYWELDRDLTARHIELASVEAAADRATLLFRLARYQLDQANVHDAAFGIDWLKDDRMDMAQSMRWSACLYRLLGDVEKAVAYPRLGRRDRMSAILGEASDLILDRMAATPDLIDRMALLDELYESVVGKVGGQAAEVVDCLPYPKTESVR